MQIRNQEIKPPFFSDNVVVYIENPMESTETFLGFNKWVWIIGHQKRKILLINTKEYIHIKLMKYMHDLYAVQKLQNTDKKNQRRQMERYGVKIPFYMLSFMSLNKVYLANNIFKIFIYILATLLRCNWHPVNCTYLKCIIWWALSHVMHIYINIVNMFITPINFLVSLCNSFTPSRQLHIYFLVL